MVSLFHDSAKVHETPCNRVAINRAAADQAALMSLRSTRILWQRRLNYTVFSNNGLRINRHNNGRVMITDPKCISPLRPRRVTVYGYAYTIFMVVPFIHDGCSDDFKRMRPTISQRATDRKVTFKHQFIRAPFGRNYDALRIIFKSSSIGVQIIPQSL